MNDGGWRLGWAYTGLVDSCGNVEFAGTTEEALAVASFVDANLRLVECGLRMRDTVRASRATGELEQARLIGRRTARPPRDRGRPRRAGKKNAATKT